MTDTETARPVGSAYQAARTALQARPRTWLITGVAGFIGSSLLETLLRLGQRVTGVDNFVTGYRRNLEVAASAATAGGGAFDFIEGDIADRDVAARACEGVDIVLHQAAIGSVPRSLADPLETNRANVDGFLTMLDAARETGARRFVYASSSAVYGDDPDLPKREEKIGRPLSPYAVSKRVNELYADVFRRNFGTELVGLRYFNVFGPRQDPAGAYAAVIPKWIANLLAGRPCEIYGDGKTSRDFCYVENVVQANLLAALAPEENVAGELYNVAVGGQTNLTELFFAIREALVHTWMSDRGTSGTRWLTSRSFRPPWATSQRTTCPEGSPTRLHGTEAQRPGSRPEGSDEPDGLLRHLRGRDCC
jgi:UDP-N-acetylglucosamine/UDP-N-acetylgalactosamine 4-epimerase